MDERWVVSRELTPLLSASRSERMSMVMEEVPEVLGEGEEGEAMMPEAEGTRLNPGSFSIMFSRSVMMAANVGL